MGLLGTLLKHPGDIPALYYAYRLSRKAKLLPKDPALSFCYDMLNKVSRSFAMVIQQLGPELRDSVCVFYLVLRALDTVEDDMAIPVPEKVPQLLRFYETCYDRSYTHTCGVGHYKDLMAQYPMVVDVFLKLPPGHQAVIVDITKRMGAGMAEFIEKEVVTIADFNLYCHYVAGLVGIGLSNLFVASGLEDQSFCQLDGMSNGTGLFLQKTNILRDYLEDIMEEPAPRMFWPRDVWSLYAAELADFKEPEHRAPAVKCLNHLVTDALGNALDSLEYLSRVRDVHNFRFCAIPQMMAIATLAECYGNGEVFERVVKIRRGLSARIMLSCEGMADVYRCFQHFSGELAAKVKPALDPNAQATLAAVEKIEEVCQRGLAGMPQAVREESDEISMPVRVLLWLMFAGYAAYAFGLGDVRAALGVSRDAGATSVDVMQQVLATMCLSGISVFVLIGRKRVVY